MISSSWCDETMEIDIKELEEQVTAVTDRKDKVDALNDLISALKNSDHQRALELSNSALELATSGEFAKVPYKNGYAIGLYNRGAIHFRLGNFTKAIRDATAAKKILEEIDNPKAHSSILGLFAGIHRRIGDYPGALANNLKATEIARQHTLVAQEAQLLNQLGVIHNNLSDFRSAMTAFNSSLQLYEEIEDINSTSLILNNLAFTYYSQKSYEEALDYAQRSLKIARQIDMWAYEATALGTLGEIYAEMGDYENSLNHLQQSISISKELGTKPMEMTGLISLGTLHSGLEEDEKAIEYLDEALAIANELEAKPEIYQSHQALAKIFTRKGEDSIALHHFEKYIAIKEEVINQDVAIKIEGLKVIHEAEIARKEAEIYRLKNEELEQMVAERTAELAQANTKLLESYDVTLEGWVKALELRNHDTVGHTLRVVDLAVNLATTMGLEGEELTHIRRGALLHDIGKMAIPDHILEKRGSHSDEESEIMQQHTEFAVQMLSPIDFLEPALDIPKYHHEKWDGSGYPNGFKGEQIPLPARIFAVVDVWDALRSDRPYRKAWPKKKSLEHIRQEAGASFDPKVVEVFLDIVSK